MSRKSRVFSLAATSAVAAAMLLPAGAVAGGGPVAHKSGTLINFITTGKLRISRQIQPAATCTATCNVTGTGLLKGPGGRFPVADSGGPFAAGEPFGLSVFIKKAAVRFMKMQPGRWHLTETLTATDATTGAVDSVTASFGFKR
jgi:hypothetical protein